MHRIFSFLLFLFFIFKSNAQEGTYQSLLLNPTLTAHANAIVRKDSIVVEIDDIDEMTIYTYRVVTVLNKFGEREVRAYTSYDEDRKIKEQHAYIYNRAGKEIKKIKERDFKDRSLISSSDLYTDNRVSYLEYTPQSYPYTVVYESEVETNSTVFIIPWEPLDSYHVSVESSSYTLKNPERIPLRFRENNLGAFKVKSQNTNFELRYSLKNSPAISYEELSPDLNKLMPEVLVALNKFSLIGVSGNATNWQEFGKWQYENLLAGRGELSAKTIAEVSKLTNGVSGNLEKARLIYNYMQQRTRYISVQLGIGGWQPMKAEEVDRLGYGDCKALTNYMKALLDSQNIPSNYAVVYAGKHQKNLEADFASMQGTHVILNIPQKEEDVWLECTNQSLPFNYIGNFTDNRKVLLIEPEGGKIVTTKKYTTSENVQQCTAKIQLNKNGDVNASLQRSSKGILYGEIYGIEDQDKKHRDTYYKKQWNDLQNLQFQSVRFNNNKDDREFKEAFKLKAENYATKAGKRLLVPLGFLEAEVYKAPRDKKRVFPLHLSRGYTYKDSFDFFLPEGFGVEALPEDIHLETDFGYFEMQAKIAEENGQKMIHLQRNYVLKDGTWPADKYDQFREFMNTITSANNQKAVLIAAP